MRKKIQNKTKDNQINIFTIMIILLTLGILVSINTVSAQEQDELKIIRNDPVVKAGEPFSITVVNSTGEPVENVDVKIQGTTERKTTNHDGLAILNAPSKPDDYVVTAQKTGYIQDTYAIKVYADPTFWESPFFPIVIAIICLISAIVYVNLRQKKDIYKRAKEISNEKLIKNQEKNGKISSFQTKKEEKNQLENSYKTQPYEISPVRSKTTDDAKVEEIRISRPIKQKEIVPIDKDKDKKEKSNDKTNSLDENDWFEGTDDIRYELDKLTGDVNEEELDKWFEGTDHLKDKIKEKVKKKKKDNN